MEVKLFATLRKYLPPGSQEGSAIISAEEGATLAGFIKMLGIPSPSAQMVLINGVNADRDLDKPLSDGDVISIFPPLAGG